MLFALTLSLTQMMRRQHSDAVGTDYSMFVNGLLYIGREKDVGRRRLYKVSM